MDDKTRRKQRGLALASSGLALALAVLALLDAIGFVHVEAGGWALTTAAAVVTVGACWVLLHGFPRAWKGWDPHFVFVPSIATALLLSELIWAAPEVRMLVLVVWPVVLVFLAGYIDFSQGALLSAMMTAGYLVAVGLAHPADLRPGVEALVAGVFYVTTLFACVVLGSLRSQRQALIAVRAELGRLVSTDALTGLPNRRHFQEALDAEMARVQRYGGSFSLALLDLDYFKQFNDQFGHPAGDAVLCELATHIRKHMRSSDVVARLGGEEFAVILVRTNRTGAYTVIERLRAAIENLELSTLGIAGYHLTVSIGIATALDDADYPAQLVRRADEALYQAKRSGRNRVVTWERDGVAALPLQGAQAQAIAAGEAG